MFLLRPLVHGFARARQIVIAVDHTDMPERLREVADEAF